MDGICYETCINNVQCMFYVQGLLIFYEIGIKMHTFILYVKKHAYEKHICIYTKSIYKNAYIYFLPVFHGQKVVVNHH